VIRFSHFKGNGLIQFRVDNEVEVSVEGDKTLFSIIKQELDRGIPEFKEFKQKGIPGRIKSYKKIDSIEDMVSFLNHLCDKFPTYGIEIYESLDDKQGDIKKQYTFLKWNGKYGAEAKFIVQDNYCGKQSFFIPGRCQDLVWTNLDLAGDKSFAYWDDFGDESVDDLEPIAF
jgi:hypothetical protein